MWCAFGKSSAESPSIRRSLKTKSMMSGSSSIEVRSSSGRAIRDHHVVNDSPSSHFQYGALKRISVARLNPMSWLELAIPTQRGGTKVCGAPPKSKSRCGEGQRCGGPPKSRWQMATGRDKVCGARRKSGRALPSRALRRLAPESTRNYTMISTTADPAPPRIPRIVLRSTSDRIVLKSATDRIVLKSDNDGISILFLGAS